MDLFEAMIASCPEYQQSLRGRGQSCGSAFTGCLLSLQRMPFVSIQRAAAPGGQSRVWDLYVQCA